MALNSATLSTLIVTKLEEKFEKGFNKYQRSEIEKFSDAIAEALISHITANATLTVTTTTPVAPGTSLQRLPLSIVANEPTQGPAATVNLAGTGTGTIS